jgi:SAM-dependent methyltransferase
MKSEKFKCNPEGYQKYLHHLREEGENDIFWRYFDGGKNKSDVFDRGEYNFNQHILPFIAKYVFDRECSLEIGYGSGAQLAQVSKYFNWSIGLDVHLEHDYVKDELTRMGIGNVELLVGDGSRIPNRADLMEDERVDFIHSWVTFMHLGKIRVFDHYLGEMYRVLKPEGVACIYFARAHINREVEATMINYMQDCKTEKERNITFIEGREDTKLNVCNLRVSLWYAVQLCEDRGFEVLEKTCSKKIVGQKTLVGGQHGLVIRKT